MISVLNVALLLLAFPNPADATDRSVRLDLPAGPLSAAIDAISAATNSNIGTSNPTLLKRRLPDEHLKGTAAVLLSHVARQAGVRLIPVGLGSWRLEPRVPQAPRPHAASIHRPLPSEREIVVIGSKRDQTLIDYPGDVTLVPGDALDDGQAVPTLAALAQRVPTVASTDWGTGQDKLFLRGIADSSFAGSSPALVDEYLGDQRLTYGAPDPGLRLYDVQSIEILDGPQGTLYGLGALGGLIRVIPNAPNADRFSGSFSSGITSIAHGGLGSDVDAIANVPVTRRLAARVVSYYALSPGYIDDLGQSATDVNRTRSIGGRGAISWRPTAGWTISLTGFGQRVDNRDAPYVDLGEPLLTRASAFAQPSFDQLTGGAVSVSGKVGAIELRSTTGMALQDYGRILDVLSLRQEYMFVSTNRTRLLTHETRFFGSTDRGSWVVGIDLLSNVDWQANGYGQIGLPAPLAILTNKVFDITVFGELTRSIAGRLSLTIGGRYSIDHLSGRVVDLRRPFHLLSTVTGLSKSEHHFLPDAGLSYRVGPDATVFVRYQRGFRPGGLTGDDNSHSYVGDGVDTVEAGGRLGVAGDSPLAFTIAGSFTRWHHIQADLLDGLGLPYIANIGDAAIASLDATLGLRLTTGWRIDAAGFVTQNRLDPSPSLAMGGGAAHLSNVAGDGATLSIVHNGTIGRRARWQAAVGFQYVGSSLFGVQRSLDLSQGGYASVRLDSDVRLGRIDMTLNIDNLLDSAANVFAVGTPFAELEKQQLTPLRPRTVRLGARYDF